MNGHMTPVVEALGEMLDVQIKHIVIGIRCMHSLAMMLCRGTGKRSAVRPVASTRDHLDALLPSKHATSCIQASATEHSIAAGMADGECSCQRSPLRTPKLLDNA